MTTPAQNSRAWSLPAENDVLDGKYRVESTLGQGGLAIVLAGRHLLLDQRVAIKILLPQWANNDQVIERFLREGRAAVKIRSEHVSRVFDVGVHEGAPYIIMEYLDGRDLEVLIEQEGPLTIEAAIDMLLQATEAIAEAHAAGVVHRDLKPANLLLTFRADGSPCIKVLDFGISKMMSEAGATSPGVVIGSPPYMSPEQITSTGGDERCDIWALGVVLYELLTGTPPFRGDTAGQILACVMSGQLPPLTSLRTEVPPALEATIMLCLEREPADRFANVAELALALAPFGSASAHASAARTLRVLALAPSEPREDLPPTALPISGPRRVLRERLRDARPRDAPLRDSSRMPRRRAALRFAATMAAGAFSFGLISSHASVRVRGTAPSALTGATPAAAIDDSLLSLAANVTVPPSQRASESVATARTTTEATTPTMGPAAPRAPHAAYQPPDSTISARIEIEAIPPSSSPPSSPPSSAPSTPPPFTSTSTAEGEGLFDDRK